MAFQSITSADAIAAIQIPGVYDTPVVLSGWAIDDMFDLDAVPTVEMVKGIDGLVAMGFIQPHAQKMPIHFQANSPSLRIFDDWDRAQKAVIDALPASMTVVFPGNGIEISFSSGGLTQYRAMPNAKKTLQTVTQEITWGKVDKINLL